MKRAVVFPRHSASTVMLMRVRMALVASAKCCLCTDMDTVFYHPPPALVLSTFFPEEGKQKLSPTR